MLKDVFSNINISVSTRHIRGMKWSLINLNLLCKEFSMPRGSLRKQSWHLL
jgi:hypothetical protein